MTDWSVRLAELAAAADVPGAVLGIWADGEQTVVPYGVLSRATGVEVTGDSVFQIGSITKPWTATMVMQLAAEGRLALDDTVAKLLPEAAFATADRVTVRQLLMHTSGIDGDVFTDTGRGDDCLEKYVALLPEVAQIFEPGAAYSYCNSGFAVLGRIIEVLDGRTFDESLKARLVEPLGLEHTVTLPEDAILHRAAVGHSLVDGLAVKSWMLPRSLTPVGLITQSAADLLAFARFHLDGGVTRDGVRLLDAEAVATMQELAVPVAGATGMAGVGLTWRLNDWGDRLLYGHDGTTVGQLAFLRIDPVSRVAVCLLTNSPTAPALFNSLFREVFAEYAGLVMPGTPEPFDGEVPDGFERHTGEYARSGVTFDVNASGEAGVNGGPAVVVRATGDRADLADFPERTYDLAPADASGDRFLLREGPDQPWTSFEFREFPDGAPYVFSSGRVTPKVP
ncbi:beta-lactamase family protein [Kribbella sp. NBC_01245]|uniref:serine hydrolase domain-containing protein n=1 Tax=Kribbella sp. NBC_01245 TaxID=2903578 RepID=UPI002E28B687|nr:serine hydrolase domain-containing protein [Kribbella sp. NBC_01245]